MWDSISIIIPISPGETEHRFLLEDLRSVQTRAEIVVVTPGDTSVLLSDDLNIRLIRSPRMGRSHQLNAGAKASTKPYLWFLHADSRLTPEAIEYLGSRSSFDSKTLYYFKLRFAKDGPRMVLINEIFANLRSKIFGIPFGDQGFLLNSKLFKAAEGFDSNVRCGEDHHLVWKLKRLGCSIRPIRCSLTTSARKYRDRGWLQTTVLHLKDTLRQALPEALKLTFEKVFR